MFFDCRIRENLADCSYLWFVLWPHRFLIVNVKIIEKLFFSCSPEKRIFMWNLVCIFVNFWNCLEFIIIYIYKGSNVKYAVELSKKNFLEKSNRNQDNSFSNGRVPIQAHSQDEDSPSRKNFLYYAKIF